MNIVSKAAGLIVLFVAGVAWVLPALAHPGSGIVADPDGHIFFVDTGGGVFKIEASGALTRIPGPAFHKNCAENAKSVDADDADRADERG